MTNFSPKLEEASEKQLLYMVNELDFRVVPLASDELTRRTLNRLRETIIELDEKNEKLQKWIFWLTVVGAILAVVQVVQTVGIFKAN